MKQAGKNSLYYFLPAVRIEISFIISVYFSKMQKSCHSAIYFAIKTRQISNLVQKILVEKELVFCCHFKSICFFLCRCWCTLLTRWRVYMFMKRWLHIQWKKLWPIFTYILDMILFFVSIKCASFHLHRFPISHMLLW